MPHIVIEHSSEGHAAFDVVALMRALHDAAAGTGVVHAADLKVRAMAFENYLVGGKRDGFCHASLYLLEGRTPEQKVMLSEALRAAMVRLMPHTTSLSVDIRDMDAEAYKKRLLDQA
ncbi:MAG: 5-carboxymethyl-2-hydroxymuconate isomerase [Tardiphaga sp.]|uniref:5-carboxymethyl-2-hydroxymuconate Delta-isomerase n=1 Tax=Tardiphaga sp. TaxID=1926292 RepID=UPI00263436CC|nr:5-carboxymethyl-2-hydroxymuconate Delta-isomerase [Tardiphaga sp.]MDB5502673.1 5-carboxymethyl-2-hydroxymuconate isomerase [Tardiphaga sp.]